MHTDYEAIGSGKYKDEGSVATIQARLVGMSVLVILTLVSVLLYLLYLAVAKPSAHHPPRQGAGPAASSDQRYL